MRGRVPNIKLTQEAVRRLKPPATDSVTYWDNQLPGFGVRVSAKGRKTWIAIYRVKDRKGGTQVMETIGTTAIIPNVGDARDMARAAMLKANQGIHPVKEKWKKAEIEAKALEAQTKTFGWVSDLFLKDMETKQRPSTFYETQRIQKRVVPILGKKLVADIKKSDIVELLEDISGRHDSKRKTTMGEARTVQGHLFSLFRWATERDHLETSPMATVAKDLFGATKARSRVLAAGEIRAFWEAMEHIGWPYGPIGKLLLLTGQRHGEVAGMRWGELNLEQRLWTLPEDRTKNAKTHIVHLSPQSLSVIKGLHNVVNPKGLVFVSETRKTAVSSIANMKQGVDARMRAALGGQLDAWVWHDLRRTLVTGMNELGIEPHVVEAVVNHISGFRSGVAGIYNYAAYKSERQAALDKWGEHIDQLIGVTPSRSGSIAQKISHRQLPPRFADQPLARSSTTVSAQPKQPHHAPSGDR